MEKEQVAGHSVTPAPQELEQQPQNQNGVVEEQQQQPSKWKPKRGKRKKKTAAIEPHLYLPLAPPDKLSGHEFYEKTLRNPKYIVAPMVEASELPWRMLSRHYQAELCYTPMFHSKQFATVAAYRRINFSTCPEDRPLIVQFCGNEPAVLLQAALHVQDSCDAVDLNFGCPQNIAKRGNYGAFLLENWPLMEAMVSILHKNLSVPVTCKIRLLPSLEDTIEMAKRLEAAGCQMLCVHGRTKENKGRTATPADWDAIRTIKEALSIPVVANGSISVFDDIERCLAATGARGVMSAYANLLHPALFTGRPRDDSTSFEAALLYLDLCEKYPTSAKIMKGHLHKLLKNGWNTYGDLRSILNDGKTCRTPQQLRTLVLTLRKRFEDGAEPVLDETVATTKKVEGEEEEDTADIFQSGIFHEEEDDEEYEDEERT
ncbi:tRNA-dihydrouridine(16/17) synthase [NAD(P)(+)]-like protein [Balamuthia mandrillaris]